MGRVDTHHTATVEGVHGDVRTAAGVFDQQYPTKGSAGAGSLSLRDTILQPDAASALFAPSRWYNEGTLGGTALSNRHGTIIFEENGNIIRTQRADDGLDYIMPDQDGTADLDGAMRALLAIPGVMDIVEQVRPRPPPVQGHCQLCGEPAHVVAHCTQVTSQVRSLL